MLVRLDERGLALREGTTVSARRPEEGRRFGGDAAHQKAMMGNMVASLIAADRRIVTTEAKAKALRPVAEKIITKAIKGGVHNQRQVVAFIRDKEMAHRLFSEIGPALRRSSGRLPADPEARPAPGGQRPDGPHRIGLSRPPVRGGGRRDGPLRRLMLVAYDGSGFHGFAAQARSARTVAGQLAEALDPDDPVTRSPSHARDGPTPGSMPPARWSTSIVRRVHRLPAGPGASDPVPQPPARAGGRRPRRRRGA